MSLWDERLLLTRALFVERLLDLGGEMIGTGRIGLSVDTRHGVKRVRVELPVDFPFSPPRVFPGFDLPHSWHRERDGAMCLYGAEGRESLPWLDSGDFLDLVSRWIESSEAGWPGDTGDLDLERYFEQSVQPLVVYDRALADIVQGPVRFRFRGSRLMLSGSGGSPGARPRGRVFGHVVDIGEPAVPPRDWSDIAAMLPPALVSSIETRARNGSSDLLFVKYKRADENAAMVLSIRHADQGIQLVALPSASSDPKILRLRSGSQAPALAEKKVLIVGVGAVGSSIADLLVRAGVGELVLRDHDVLRPGNAVRHVAAAHLAGLSKVEAVKRTLDAYDFSGTHVEAVAKALTDPMEVDSLLAEFDLIIDASADAAASTLMAEAARSFGQKILSVCVQDEGRVVRVDVIPSDPSPALPPARLRTRGAAVLEPGCGEPVSLTPAFAVSEAASLGARFATQLLLGSLGASAGEIREYA